MPNYLVVLLLSVFVLLSALYVNTVERRIIQIKHELLQQVNEKVKVKVEFESTKKELKQELESTKKELKQELESTRNELKQELESTRNELKQELESTRKKLKQVHVQLYSTRDVLRKEIIEKNNARGEELGLIREVVNAFILELKDSEIKKAPRTTQGCLSGVFGEHAFPEIKFPASAYITFNPPFTAVPALVYGLYLYDSSKDANARLVTNVSNISKTGFNLQISTWGETKMWGARISWMACPK